MSGAEAPEVRGTLRVLVVDDEPPSRDRLVRALRQHAAVAEIDEAPDGLQALAALGARSYDLIMADVEMPGLDGLTMLERIPPQDRPCVVLVTAHVRYALDAFEVEAMDFLAKPWSRERLHRVVDRVAASVGSPRIALRSGAEATIVDPEQILVATAAKNYVRVRVTGGEHLSRETLVDLEARLPVRAFVRAHRSVLVRVSAIQRLEHDEAEGSRLVLEDGSIVRVSRSRLTEVRRALGLDR